MPSHLDIKGLSQKLGECGISFFATASLAQAYAEHFPQSLQDAPLLIPGPETVIRTRLLRWLAELKIQPRIVGEFDDSALMQAFGQSGTGVFIAPSVIADEVMRQFDVELIGQTEAVTESFYAITVERKILHPGIVAITEGRDGSCLPKAADQAQAARGFIAISSDARMIDTRINRLRRSPGCPARRYQSHARQTARPGRYPG